MKCTFRDFLEESEEEETINEMAKTVRPQVTGLSQPIWLGDSGNHQPRVKLKTSNSRDTRGGTISILLNRTADVPKGQKNMPNRSQVIKDVRRWVRYNLEVLIQLDKQFLEDKEKVDNLLAKLVHLDDIPKSFK